MGGERGGAEKMYLDRLQFEIATLDKTCLHMYFQVLFDLINAYTVYL